MAMKTSNLVSNLQDPWNEAALHAQTHPEVGRHAAIELQLSDVEEKILHSAAVHYKLSAAEMLRTLLHHWYHFNWRKLR